MYIQSILPIQYLIIVLFAHHNIVDPYPQINAANVDLEKMSDGIIALNNFLNVITQNYDKAIETKTKGQIDRKYINLPGIFKIENNFYFLIFTRVCKLAIAKAITTVYGPICLAIIEYYRMEFEAKSFYANFMSVVADLTNG